MDTFLSFVRIFFSISSTPKNIGYSLCIHKAQRKQKTRRILNKYGKNLGPILRNTPQHTFKIGYLIKAFLIIHKVKKKPPDETL